MSRLPYCDMMTPLCFVNVHCLIQIQKKKRKKLIFPVMELPLATSKGTTQSSPCTLHPSPCFSHSWTFIPLKRLKFAFLLNNISWKSTHVVIRKCPKALVEFLPRGMSWELGVIASLSHLTLTATLGGRDGRGHYSHFIYAKKSRNSRSHREFKVTELVSRIRI